MLKNSLGLCLGWLHYWHEHASAHASERPVASVLTRATILGTLCIFRHLSRKISDELVSNPVWPRETDELIPVSGVIFINIQQAAFEHADPESAKKTDNSFCAFGICACKSCS